MSETDRVNMNVSNPNPRANHSTVPITSSPPQRLKRITLFGHCLIDQVMFKKITGRTNCISNSNIQLTKRKQSLANKRNVLNHFMFITLFNNPQLQTGEEERLQPR